MATEKTAARRKSGSLWAVAARGVGLSLVLWACGAGLLAALMTAGVVGEAGAFPVLLALTTVSAFLGALSAIHGTPWGTLVSSMLTAGLFAALLLCMGLLTWSRIAWTGHGGTLLFWALIGGAAAGVIGRPRTKKRPRRAWR